MERGYADFFPARKHMDINNLPLLRLPRKVRGDRNFVPKYRDKIRPPLKLVGQDYADFFPTRKLIKINNLPLLRPPKRL